MTTTHSYLDHADDADLPMPAEELQALADYYDTHSTAEEMGDDYEVVDPRPMTSTSLRLPTEVRDALKDRARAEGMRYTAFLRRVLEDVVDPDPYDEAEEPASREQLDELADRVAQLEQALTATRAELARTRTTGAKQASKPKRSTSQASTGKASTAKQGRTKASTAKTSTTKKGRASQVAATSRKGTQRGYPTRGSRTPARG